MKSDRVVLAPLAARRSDLLPALRVVGIVGVGAAVPAQIVTNADLERLVDTSDRWIVERTGMRERRRAAPGQATSDLAIDAARAALANAGIEGAEVDLVIVATATPDMAFPATACLVQHAIGAVRAAGFDLSIACSGFVNALMTARAMLAAGDSASPSGGKGFHTALVIGAEVLSTITDYTDRRSCVLFGDGAGAVVLRAEAASGTIIDCVAGVDGSGHDAIELPAGGSRRPTSAETLAAGEHFLRIDGQRVFKFAVQRICSSIDELLQRNGLTVADLDLLLPHQANLRIIEAAAARLGIGMDRVFVNIERYGNTSAASIPIALAEAAAAGRLREGAFVALVGFGSGLSWGAALLRW